MLNDLIDPSGYFLKSLINSIDDAFGEILSTLTNIRYGLAGMFGIVVRGSSPWISTTTQMEVVNGYKNEEGVVWIDLTKVPGEIVVFDTIGEVWVNDLDFYQKLAYYRAVWAQEVLIKKHIPQEAMTLIHEGKK